MSDYVECRECHTDIFRSEWDRVECENGHGWGDIMPPNKSGQVSRLEAELKAAKEGWISASNMVHDLQIQLMKVPNLPFQFFPNPLIDESKRLQERAEALAAALEKILNEASKSPNIYGAVENCRDIAREALASLDGRGK